MYIKYCCSHCHDDFEEKEECFKHEELCPCNPDRQKEETATGCRSCEKCTAEGYFNPECKLKHATLPKLSCSDHIPARA